MIVSKLNIFSTQISKREREEKSFSFPAFFYFVISKPSKQSLMICKQTIFNSINRIIKGKHTHTYKKSGKSSLLHEFYHFTGIPCCCCWSDPSVHDVAVLQEVFHLFCENKKKIVTKQASNQPPDFHLGNGWRSARFQSTSYTQTVFNPWIESQLSVGNRDNPGVHCLP
jgi:hypothetical protein